MKKEKKKKTASEYVSNLVYKMFFRLIKPRIKINKVVIKQSGKPGPPPY